MAPHAPLIASAVAALFVGAATAQPASAPAGSSAARVAAAVAACEKATRETFNNTRGPATEVAFNAPPAAQPGPADATDLVLRGSGRARTAAGARPFSYSCNVDVRSGDVAGVVVRDSASVAVQAAPAPRPVEPDLANVSPTACESSAAVALQRRWPNVSQIAFSADTRMLQQDSAGNANLRGQGTAQPAPGAPSTHFSYQCAIDPRNGRVLSARVQD
jgi:hypothetical protein